MVLTFAELKQHMTDPGILSANSWLTGPIHGNFIYTGHLDGPNNLMVLDLDIVDLKLIKMILSGYPFLRKMSVILLISASILLFEQIIST